MRFIIGKEFEKKRLFLASAANGPSPDILVIANSILQVYQSASFNIDVEFVREYDSNVIWIKSQVGYISKHPVQKLLDRLSYGVIGSYLGLDAELNLVYKLRTLYDYELGKL